MNGENARRFADDGVVVVRQGLDAVALAAARKAFEWSLANPGPYSKRFETGEAIFLQDSSNPAILAHYEELLTLDALPRIARSVWGDSRVWFMFEQIFLKEGGETRRTPWHQDSPYLTVMGDQVAVMWINFTAIPKEDCLEFVKGSHKGPTFNGSAFDPNDDTKPAFEGSDLPRLPDIQANRGEYDILSWDLEPGDVLVFHPAILHGGAPTHPGGERRTLTLRLFGEDAAYRVLPWIADASSLTGRTSPKVDGLDRRLKHGDPLRDAAFPQLAPEGGPLRPTDWGDLALARGQST